MKQSKTTNTRFYARNGRVSGLTATQTMTVQLLDVIDGAQLVITDEQLHAVGVWHGGHTINFYAVAPGDADARPSDSISIGDFETGDVSVSEAREAIQETFSDERHRLGIVG